MNLHPAISYTVVAIWFLGAACAVGGLVWLALLTWDLVRTRIMGRQRAMLALRLLREHERAAAQKGGACGNTN